jgi:hypothetical protein
MKIKKQEQKLISFNEVESEMNHIQKQLDNDWQIISLYSNGRSFVGILEKKCKNLPDEYVYIPPRKKIKFSF